MLVQPPLPDNVPTDMTLSDTQVRAAKPADKQYKLTDGEGMHLLVHTNGSKYWRLSYRFGGKQKTLVLGVYPTRFQCFESDRAEQSRPTTHWPRKLRHTCGSCLRFLQWQIPVVNKGTNARRGIHVCLD